MKRLFYLIILIIPTIASGQIKYDIERKATCFQDSLRKIKVDTLLLYSLNCVGEKSSEVPCDSSENIYLIWNQNKSTFLQKFDACRLYNTIILDSINPLNFYILHRKSIDHEKIYHPTYIQSKQGNVVTTITQTIDHTCFYDMTFLIKGKKIFKHISDYDLTFKIFENGRKNIYYNYNKQTQIKKTIDQILILVGQMETNKRFIAQ